MAILGLLILAAAAVIGVETALANQSDVVVETFGRFSTVPMSVLFLFGVLLTTLAIFGLFLITGSVQRRRRRRVEAKHRVAEQETSTRLTDIDRTNAELVEENDRLRAELAAERRAAATMGGVAVPPGVGDVTYGDQVSDAVRSETISETGRYEPYPGEPVTGSDVTGRGVTERTDDKAGIVGRFRDNQ